MLVEIVVAVISGSLALLADAGHMLTDAGALAGSIWAIRLAAPLALGQVQALPVPGHLDVGDRTLELHPTGGHTADGMAVWAPWAGVLVAMSVFVAVAVLVGAAVRLGVGLATGTVAVAVGVGGATGGVAVGAGPEPPTDNETSSRKKFVEAVPPVCPEK